MKAPLEFATYRDILLKKALNYDAGGYRFKHPTITFDDPSMAHAFVDSMTQELQQHNMDHWQVESAASALFRKKSHFINVFLKRRKISKAVLIPVQVEYFRQRIPDIIQEIVNNNVFGLVFLDKSAREFYLMLRQAWVSTRNDRFPEVRFLNIGSEKFDLIQKYVLKNKRKMRALCPQTEIDAFDEMISLFKEALSKGYQCSTEEGNARQILLRLMPILFTEDIYSDIFGKENLAELKKILAGFKGKQIMVIDDLVMTGKTFVFTKHIMKTLCTSPSPMFCSVINSSEEFFTDNPQSPQSFHVPWSKRGSFDGNHWHLIKDPRNPRKFVSERRKSKRTQRRNRRLRNELKNVFI